MIMPNSTVQRDGRLFIDDEIKDKEIDTIHDPLENVEIRILRKPSKESQNYVMRIQSDSLGRFETGTVYSLGWYDLYLRAYKNGFKPIERKFRHDRFNHEAYIFLVPDSIKNTAIIKPHEEPELKIIE